MNSSTTNEQNEYAKDITGKVVYILDVERGQKDYWCMGCGHEMQAIHRTIEHYKPYFRHVAEDVKTERKCTFSNQEYRHKLAMEILQFTKRIKVPNLYSYSPDGNKAVLLEEAKFIEANHVRAELTFYEDDDGNVLHGKNPDLENKNLLIRPDLTFFNSKEEPILLIEIVVSHKLDDEKKVKLRRLGINTIQIVIPKDSEENIAKSLQTSINTKWVYNYVQQRTDYLQVSKGNREDLSPIDELQRQLFEESIACRKSQIGNLIRSISRCLEGQQYRNLVFQLEQELSRVKTNTDRNRERLEQLQSESRERVSERFRDSFEQIDNEERELTEHIEREREKLAGEYRAKGETIEQEDGKLEARYIKRRGELQNLQRETDQQHRETEASISERGGVGEKAIRIQESSRGIQREIEAESARAGKIRQSTEDIRRRVQLLPIEFEHREREFRDEFDREENKLEGIPGRVRNSIIQTINGTTPYRVELPERIKKLLEARGILNDYENKQLNLERYKTMLECIRKGDYKKWD